MNLSSADILFVERRERLTKLWPLAGACCLVLITVFSAWLWLKTPHLIDPWRVIESLETGTLSDSTAGIMAAMLPIVMLAFLVFIFITVLFSFVAFHNERRLIRLLRKLEADSGFRRPDVANKNQVRH